MSRKGPGSRQNAVELRDALIAAARTYKLNQDTAFKHNNDVTYYFDVIAAAKDASIQHELCTMPLERFFNSTSRLQRQKAHSDHSANDLLYDGLERQRVMQAVCHVLIYSQISVNMSIADRRCQTTNQSILALLNPKLLLR